MHLFDGFLNAQTCASAGVVAAGTCGWAARQVRAEIGDRVVPLMGVMSACIFSAQMVNFPILFGSSGHLLGGVLAAVVLGPWAGVLAMSVVLVVQCLLFYDGGLTVLGANIVNMALAGSLAGYAIYALVRRVIRSPAGDVAGAVIASWFSVQLAATLCALELWWSGTYPLAAALPALLIVHSVIGVGEALITGSVVAFLLSVKPSMLYALRHEGHRPSGAWQWAAAGLAVALFVAFCLSPLASAKPDGLEHVTEQLGAIEAPATPALVPLPDYQVTVPGRVMDRHQRGRGDRYDGRLCFSLGAVARSARPSPAAASGAKFGAGIIVIGAVPCAMYLVAATAKATPASAPRMSASQSIHSKSRAVSGCVISSTKPAVIATSSKPRIGSGRPGRLRSQTTTVSRNPRPAYAEKCNSLSLESMGCWAGGTLNGQWVAVMSVSQYTTKTAVAARRLKGPAVGDSGTRESDICRAAPRRVERGVTSGVIALSGKAGFHS